MSEKESKIELRPDLVNSRMPCLIQAWNVNLASNRMVF